MNEIEYIPKIATRMDDGVQGPRPGQEKSRGRLFGISKNINYFILLVA